MVQSNVIVTYAPAQRNSATARERSIRGAPPRWGVTLAGALLAGGAVFALGQFVRPDGSLRETAAPSNTPLASAGRIAIPPASPPKSEAQPAESEPAPLPYLALVRDPPPSPAAKVSKLAAVSKPNERAASQRLSPLAAVDRPTVRRQSQPEGVSLPPPPEPQPVARPRRDLEGFLSEQGLVLAPSTPEVSGEAPVSAWTEGELASTQSPELSGAATPQPSASGPPATGSSPVLELTESEALAVSATPAEAPGVAALATPAKVQTAELAIADRPADPSPVALPLMTEGPDQSSELAKEPPRAAIEPTSANPAINAAPVAAHEQLFPTAVVNGQALGAVTMRDLGAEGMAVHLGALVGLLKLRMPQAEFERLSSAAAAEQFVTLDQLRNAGISVEYDERAGRLLIDAD